MVESTGAQVNRLQEIHEELVARPGMSVLGEGPAGKANASTGFVRQLETLTPAHRRLAIAIACAQPWREDPASMPDCYRRALDHATYEADAEHRPCSGGEFSLDELFQAHPEPISRTVLLQLAEMPPTRRRVAMAFMWSGCWRPKISEQARAEILVRRGFDYGDGEEYPEWVQREYDLAAAEHFEQVSGAEPR